MAEVSWRSGRNQNVSAEVAFIEMERIRAARGDLTPALVVEESEAEDAPLHKCFEWDNGKAGDLYRRQQARAIINGIQIVSPKAVGPAYVNVVIRNSEPIHHYMPVRDALEDPELRAQVLAEARSSLKAWRSRYGFLREMAQVVTVVDSVLDEEEFAEENQA